jgi:hypothetical protein
MKIKSVKNNDIANWLERRQLAGRTVGNRRKAIKLKRNIS